MESCSVARAGVQWHNLGSLQPLPSGSSDCPASALLSSLDCRCVLPRLASFCIFNESGFHPVGQADLKLPTSRDPPALVSQSAGITGMSHCAWFNKC